MPLSSTIKHVPPPHNFLCSQRLKQKKCYFNFRKFEEKQFLVLYKDINIVNPLDCMIHHSIRLSKHWLPIDHVL